MAQKYPAQMVLKFCVAGFLLKFVAKDLLHKRQQSVCWANTQTLWRQILLNLPYLLEKVRILVPQASKPSQFPVHQKRDEISERDQIISP